jgi:integrase
MRKKLTAKFIETFKAGPKRVEIYDTVVTGLGFMVTPTGNKSFPVRGRIRGGDGRSTKLATLPITLGLEKARREARKVLEIAAEGKDPREIAKAERLAKVAARANTFANVVQRFVAVEGRRDLRTFDQVEWSLRKYALPRLGERPITEIRKSDAMRLYREVAEGHGARSAERACQHLVAVLNWFARETNDFACPIPRGHVPAPSRKRHRVLSNIEIAALWRATEVEPDRHNAFYPLMRLLLLTGRRRGELAGMTWGEIGPEGHLLPASRNKTKQPLLSPLAPAAREIIEQQPKLGTLIFANGMTDRPLSDWDRLKRKLDVRMLAILRERDPQATLDRWTIHDLRRSARTLMSKLRIPTEVAEHALGHVVGGIRSRYDLHEYYDEKREAYAALADEISRIVSAASEAPARKSRSSP